MTHPTRRRSGAAGAPAALAFFLSCVLAACGGGSDDADTPAASSSAIEAPTETATAAATAAQPARVPGAPRALAAVSGNGFVKLTFSAPLSDGGAPITSYRAACSRAGGALVANAPASPVTVTGLSNGSTYACSVSAINRVGTGPASAAVQALASAVPAVLAIDLAAPANYLAPVLPRHYDAEVAAQDNTPRNEPASDRIATLGRVLFFDRALSVNDGLSCADCHQAAQGFADAARFSKGFAGGLTSAHSMRLANLRWYRPGSAFWDRRAATFEIQAGMPIQSAVEMGFDAPHGGLVALTNKLQALPYYPELFRWAFGDGLVTDARLRSALAQFERAMVSTHSRWDTAYAAVYNPALPDKGRALPLPGFSAPEERGRALFMLPPPQGGLGCAGCHQPPTFALAPNSLSNGLDAGETVVFKSPSLKNVGRSRAFMHDGRFATLAQVVEHYDHGVQPGPATDRRLLQPNGQPRRLNLSAADKAALVAFLQTLDDPVLAADPRFADPFRR